MFSPFDLYPAGPMRNATILTGETSNWTTGNPAELANDLNPCSRAIQNTPGSNAHIALDLGAAPNKISTNIVFFAVIQNFTAAGVQACSILGYDSTDGSSWGPMQSAKAISSYQGNICQIGIQSTAKRYYRFTVTGGTAALEVSTLLVCNYITIPRAFQLPDLGGHQFHNVVRNTPGGVTHVAGRSSWPQEIRPRRYRFTHSAYADLVEAAHLDAVGRLMPCVLAEGQISGENGANRLVRFASDKYSGRRIGAEYYSPEIAFEEILQIPEGEAY